MLSVDSCGSSPADAKASFALYSNLSRSAAGTLERSGSVIAALSTEVRASATSLSTWPSFGKRSHKKERTESQSLDQQRTQYHGKAVMRMKSRYGKSSGNASAAASVTIPRIPDQPTTSPVMKLRLRTPGSARVPLARVCRNTQLSLTSITTTRITDATSSHSPRSASLGTSRIEPSRSPINERAIPCGYHDHITINPTIY